MKFFKTQTNLKIISLGPCSFHECDDILVQLFGNNPQLKTVNLTTSYNNFEDFGFCEGIVNPSVENLTLKFYYDQDATQYLIALTKLFPNVKKFTFTVYEYKHGFDPIHNWKSLESINCTLNIKIYDLNLQKIDLFEKLTTCTIIISYEMCFEVDKILEFLKRHQNIKHFAICLDKNYATIPDEFPVLVVKTLKSLETLICNGKKFLLSNY